MPVNRQLKKTKTCLKAFYLGEYQIRKEYLMFDEYPKNGPSKELYQCRRVSRTAVLNAQGS